jgi:hypothetical protein
VALKCGRRVLIPLRSMHYLLSPHNFHGFISNR